MIQLTVNGTGHEVEVSERMPLLWVLREELGLTGTKFGCGAGICGACTVLVDGVPRSSCNLPIGQLDGAVTTIEGVGTPDAPHPVQESWIEHQVAQCGYCQPGQIISTIALLQRTPRPSDADIDAALQGNACRCCTYPRIREAVKTAAARQEG